MYIKLCQLIRKTLIDTIVSENKGHWLIYQCIVISQNNMRIWYNSDQFHISFLSTGDMLVKSEWLYFQSMEPDEPVYDCLNLQLKGYDFAVLEACQSQIHRYAEVMGIQVDEW